jgi:hypothetical protein
MQGVAVIVQICFLPISPVATALAFMLSRVLCPVNIRMLHPQLLSIRCQDVWRDFLLLCHFRSHY